MERDALLRLIDQAADEGWKELKTIWMIEYETRQTKLVTLYPNKEAE